MIGIKRTRLCSVFTFLIAIQFLVKQGSLCFQLSLMRRGVEWIGIKQHKNRSKTADKYEVQMNRVVATIDF